MFFFFPSLRGRLCNSVVVLYNERKKFISCGYWRRSVRHISAAPPRSAAKKFGGGGGVGGC